MNKMIKCTYNLALTWCLIFPATIFANVPMNNVKVQKVAEFLSEETGNVNSKLQEISKIDSIKIKDLQSFFKKNDIDTNMAIPSVSNAGNILTYSLNNEKVTLSFFENDSFEINYLGNTAKISSKMTNEKMLEEIKNKFLPENKTTLIDLMISPVFAEPMVVFASIVLVAGLAAAVVDLYNKKKAWDAYEIRQWEKYMAESQTQCERLDVSAGLPQDYKPVLTNKLNAMTDHYVKECGGKVKADMCEMIKKVRNCFKDKIILAESAKGSNNSPRINDKKIEFNETTEKFELKLAPTKSK